ncbi:MAG TPA: autoinducer binding domain-containing protein, partial [Methylophilaceae bacterium]|nr:autoinducer binding domain-containing protein [Methylophilaceae bacterium]
MYEIDDYFRLLQAPDENSWSNALFSIAQTHGFTQTVYGIVLDKKQPLENAFLQSNYAPRWRRTYDSEKLHYIDPTVSHCLKSTVPLIWQPETFKSNVQKQFYEEACGYGLRSGITYPIHGPNGEFGVISFVSDACSDKNFQRDLHHSLGSL